ncbi:TPA: hypothetical protein U2B49_000330 [Streptococcus suis]|uniref:hypothetical protein n=1 Tax=Streptococcus suis TaxID=1307 RepID=UPI00155684A2|nr:hypothetical protein [Streptococcus suis]MCQ8262006.1 hypothetical protein [Streptococcus suis]MDW8764614.1 hypothetical protein [Streptococcus suis]NQJ19366.1 hypothetical protein [Streptococcus suis]NQK55179.1 hypothetical protein [Streptococcus suis]NQK56986.1 hypothetical protein [Streptococcus suis]
MLVEKLIAWYRKANLDEYNPWIKDGKGAKKIDEFIRARNNEDLDFSWFNHGRAATRYSLPQPVQGDYLNANFYCCLYNPGVAENVWASEASSVIKFIDEFTTEAPTPYIQRMFDFDDEIHFNDVYDKIINRENVLHQEMQIIKRRLEEIADESPSKDWDTIVDENMANIVIGEKNPTSPKCEDSCYYIKTYYKGLLARKDSSNYLEDTIETLKGIAKKQAIDRFDTFKNLPICNLDLVPFASKNKSNININKSNKDYINAYKHFVAAIILTRIAKYYSETDKGDEKPVFIFRSRADWFECIENIIREEIYKEEAASFKGIYQSDLREFFYEFQSQSASISPNNCSQNIVSDNFEKKFRQGSGIATICNE